MAFGKPTWTPPVKLRDQPPGTVQPATRAGTYAGTTGAAVPKEPRLENPHLLRMMRQPDQVCLLRVPGVCSNPGQPRSDCCACHGNSSEFNKGLGMKAHDWAVVRGCARCHTWLDSSYSATGEQRAEAFLGGLKRQAVEYEHRLKQHDTHAVDKQAMHWALAHLRQRGYA